MKFLLDTNAVIALLNGNQSFIQRLKQFKPNDFGLSSIVLFELYYGAEKSQKRDENIAKLRRLPFEIISFNAQDAIIAGKVRSDLAKLGTPIGAYDVQIAAQAINRQLTLITHNVKEFSRIQELIWEDWM